MLGACGSRGHERDADGDHAERAAAARAAVHRDDFAWWLIVVFATDYSLLRSGSLMSRRFVAALYGVDIAFAMLACSSTAGHERGAQPVRTARDRHSLTLPLAQTALVSRPLRRGVFSVHSHEAVLPHVPDRITELFVCAGELARKASTMNKHAVPAIVDPGATGSATKTALCGAASPSRVCRPRRANQSCGNNSGHSSKCNTFYHYGMPQPRKLRVIDCAIASFRWLQTLASDLGRCARSNFKTNACHFHA